MLPPPVPGRHSPASRPLAHEDDAIRATDGDAAASRLSAVSLGYLDDPYVSLLYRPQRSVPGGPGARKAPLINVGTHHRTAALDVVVDSFLDGALRSRQAGNSSASSSPEKPTMQVVSLGAGSDTRFWRLAERKYPKLRYVEVDFPHLTAIKAQRIARSSVLVGALRPQSEGTSVDQAGPSSKPYTVTHGGAALSSQTYSLLPLDLREGVSGLQEHLLPLLDAEVPTLLLAECVLCYMKPEQGTDILSWFGSTFPQSAAVVYEMCGLNDAFGRVMQRNLAARHLSLPGAVFATPQAQADRFLDPALGGGVFQRAGAKSLWDVRQDIIGAEELKRLGKLEFLDEIEELRLVLSHYCVAWASKGSILEHVGL